MTILLLIVIFVYTGFVIYKKGKQLKEGKFCNCSCENCNSKKDCHF